MRNIFLFFVDRIRGPETDVLIPTSLSDGGTHTHPFYKKASPSPSSLFGSSRMRGWEEPLLRVFPLSSSSSCFLTRPTSKLAKMRDLCPSPSSPHLKLSMDAIRREIQPHWGSPWASLLHLKHFQVSNPFNLLDLCFPSSRESPPSLLGALFFLFFGLPF